MTYSGQEQRDRCSKRSVTTPEVHIIIVAIYMEKSKQNAVMSDVYCM